MRDSYFDDCNIDGGAGLTVQMASGKAALLNSVATSIFLVEYYVVSRTHSPRGSSRWCTRLIEEKLLCWLFLPVDSLIDLVLLTVVMWSLAAATTPKCLF